MIEKFATYIPNELKNLSGAVFYSGRNAFQGKKDLYIMGLNPGGSDILHKDATVSRHTETILSMANPDWWNTKTRYGVEINPAPMDYNLEFFIFLKT